ncbi:uncharacterized protein LOC123257758 isoform X2 [Drosophila ananassae]|uniref:uncharacterized protein LOC123257758 isoform X2 n=1 Tax=Drosophila ananassae TaxID=7217 RepID=UPI001CFFFBB1|nr:uncharacterized protein LOC123257758 isoform X2 [Drosophila ananassae]
MSSGRETKPKGFAPVKIIRRSTSSSPVPPSHPLARSANTRSKSESLTPTLPKPQSISRTPIGTRSVTRKTVSATTMAFATFISVCDKLTHFEAKINEPSTSESTQYALEVRRDHVKKLWETIESEYDKCSQVLQQEASSSGEWQAIEAKYDYCYSVYERCVAQLTEVIERMSVPTLTRASSTAQLSMSSGCRLPPCDTEVFRGDYLRWPTFRDLFTAIYVNNPRLTPVEKLFHLNAKTEGEAKAIVAKSPLTHDGFGSAWTALCDRFENKRLLVNSQLKILFNLPVVVVESGAALKELQSTIQGCLTALEHSKISIDNWDCLLVFLCSSKLPKLTLSLWEQSLSNKCEIPAWHEMNSFLSERYRALEAIEDVKPSSSIKMVNSQPPSKNTGSKRINSFETNVTQGPKNCDLCAKENHPVRVCPRFLQMPVSERSAYIRRKKLCLNCFAGGHQLKECTSKHNCFTC